MLLRVASKTEKQWRIPPRHPLHSCQVDTLCTGLFWPPCSPSQSCISLLSAHWFFQAWNKLTKLPFNCCFDLYNNVLITTLGSSSVLLITWLPLPVGASQNVKRHQTKLNTELNILAHPPSSNYTPKVSVLSAYLQNSFNNDFVLKTSLKTKP